MTGYRRVVIEADGGSRSNPGQAAYGARLLDADTGQVIAERAERIGVASNNVAEYRGLIGGLELYREHADGAALEVRLDSKLVVEQMAGRWKIKHPDIRPLATRANALAPAGTTYTWIPREQNAAADRLANLALDGPMGAVIGEASQPVARRAVEPAVEPAAEPAAAPKPSWEQGAPTTIVLVRHGDTDHTRARLFSGSTGVDPALNEEGRAQVQATADWLAPRFGSAPAVVASPMRRTQDSAAIIAAALGSSVSLDAGLVEADFGEWEGLSYPEVIAADPEAFTSWLKDPDQPSGRTGDSMTGVAARARGVLDRLLTEHTGQVVVVVTHLTPIKMFISEVLELPMEGLFRTEIATASVTVLAWYPDGRAVVRLLNGQPGGPTFANRPPG